MVCKLPTLFTFESSDIKLLYLENENKPFYDALSVAKALGKKNPSAAALSMAMTVCAKIERYCDLMGKTPEKDTPIKIANSVRTGKIVISDGNMTVLAVTKKAGFSATFSYYYNQDALYEVLLASEGNTALRFKYWITHEVLPAIAKTGEYIAVRKTGIGFRKHLTDAIKRRIDCQELDESAYPTITDAIYLIRYGMNAAQLRDRLGLGDSDNIREHLSEDELNAIALIENDLTGALNLGLTLNDVLANKAFVMLHRQPL